jgi:hypothetical protein
MYPQSELNRLAIRKTVIRAGISLHRVECVRAIARIAQPVALLDRIMNIWRQLPPIVTVAAVPLGLFVTRKLFPRRKILGSLVRWAPLLFSAVRGISSALKTHPTQSQSPPASR